LKKTDYISKIEDRQYVRGKSLIKGKAVFISSGAKVNESTADKINVSCAAPPARLIFSKYCPEKLQTLFQHGGR